MGFMKNTHVHIQPLHEHYAHAMSFLSRFHIPKSFEDFHRSFYWSNWDVVGEMILLGVQSRKLGITKTASSAKTNLTLRTLENFGELQSSQSVISFC